jgi:hypothetical protein
MVDVRASVSSQPKLQNWWIGVAVPFQLSELEPLQVVVVYVYAATGAVMGAGRRLSKPSSGRGSPPE